MEKIDQLGIKLLDDGGVQLEQDIGCGETTSVYLHPIHLRYLFEKVGTNFLICLTSLHALPPCRAA